MIFGVVRRLYTIALSKSTENLLFRFSSDFPSKMDNWKGRNRARDAGISGQPPRSSRTACRALPPIRRQRRKAPTCRGAGSTANRTRSRRSLGALGHKGLFAHGVDEAVAGQGTRRGKRQLIAARAAIQHVLPRGMIQQTVRHKADHPAARCKAGLLRGGVRTGSPAGDERKALGRSELSGLHGKAAVIRPELPRADERNAARAEQGRVAAAEQGGRALRLAHAAQARREAVRKARQDRDSLRGSGLEIAVQRVRPVEQRRDLQGGRLRIAERRR